MPSEIKELMFREIVGEFEKNPYAVISSFEGLSVAEFAEFRRGVEKAASRSLVVKHSLAKKAFEMRKLEGDAGELLKGQMIISFAVKEPQDTCRAIMAFVKTNSRVAPRGLVFEGKVYGDQMVTKLATLPTRQELLTQTVVRIKSPITGFVLTLNQLLRGFVVALNEIKKQKEASSQTV